MTLKLRARRLALGLSQQALAERVGTTQPQIDRLEKGERKLTQQWATRLAKELQCHPFDLFDDDRPAAELSPREVALLGLFRGLSPEEQERFLKVADATAHALAQPPDKRNSNDG